MRMPLSNRLAIPLLAAILGACGADGPSDPELATGSVTLPLATSTPDGTYRLLDTVFVITGASSMTRATTRSPSSPAGPSS